MKKKQTFITLAAMALTATLAIGGTLAYLNDITETKQNVFTSDKGIDIDLIEEKWEEEGKTKAENYIPGDVIAKDPTITIDKGSAWVGMSLDYLNASDEKIAYGTVKDGIKTGFRSYAEHGDIHSTWKLIARNGHGSELYINTEKIEEPNGKTAPIFSDITVNAGITKVTETSTFKYFTKTTELVNGEITKETLTEVQGAPQQTTSYFDQNGNAVTADPKISQLPSFKIDAKGYAVQTNNFDAYTDAIPEIINLANQGVEVGNKNMFIATN